MPQTNSTPLHTRLLKGLIVVAREAEALLGEDDPDPERFELLLAKRDRLFQALEQTVPAPADQTPEVKALAQELLDLDRRCMEQVKTRLQGMPEALQQVKLQQRSLHAYGRIAPESAPRGAFFDTTHT